MSVSLSTLRNLPPAFKPRGQGPWRSFLDCCGGPLLAADPLIIDIHQHTNYTGRSNAELIQHQREMVLVAPYSFPPDALSTISPSERVVTSR